MTTRLPSLHAMIDEGSSIVEEGSSNSEEDNLNPHTLLSITSEIIEYLLKIDRHQETVTSNEKLHHQAEDESIVNNSENSSKKIKLQDDHNDAILPPLQVASLWDSVRNEEMERKILHCVLTVLTSDGLENVDEASDFIELLFNVFTTNSSLTIDYHIALLQESIEVIFMYYTSLIDSVGSSTTPDTVEMFENVMISNVLKYLITILGRVGKHLTTFNRYQKGDSCAAYIFYYCEGIQLLDKYMLKFIPNHKLLNDLKEQILSFTHILYDLMVPIDIDVELDFIRKLSTTLLDTLSYIPFVKQTVYFDVYMLSEELKSHINLKKVYLACLLIGTFRFQHYEFIVSSCIDHGNQLIRAIAVWSYGNICDNIESCISRMQKKLVSEQSAVVKVAIIKFLSTYISKSCGLPNDFYDNLFPSIFTSVCHDLEKQQHYSLTKTWYLIQQIIQKSAPSRHIGHLLSGIFNLLESSMRLQCTTGTEIGNVNNSFKEVHAKFFKMLSEKRILSLFTNDEIAVIKDSAFVAIKRIVFSNSSSFDQILLNNYVDVICELMDRDTIQTMITSHHVLVTALLRSISFKKRAGHSFFSFVCRLGVYLKSFLKLPEIVNILVQDMIQRVPSLVESFTTIDDTLSLLFLLNSIAELVKEYGPLIQEQESLRLQLSSSIQANIIPAVQSKSVIMNSYRSSEKSIDVFMIIKSTFCNIISKIYCYFDPQLVINNFSKTRETFLYFPENPQLRMGLEQLEYFTTFIGVLESITNVENTNLDVTLLQNPLLLEMAISILKRLKHAVDSFYFRAELNVVYEGEAMTAEWKQLMIKANRLRYILETQARDLDIA
ncbi:hypothetical protein C9374_008176 [Naegleria lovaniensis]|uniref:Uncharacterized protein n=1 Tax=Naegleria lovaniensis TaxID=51637 RepID=A0AA88KFQ4_NAELO|nr:uncharacterized protein C9374_008176 [Naegleria lovaniensis]KAG2378537.1 hypothetical protein C9374_008176 [Naegleria lovaniensis]